MEASEGKTERPSHLDLLAKTHGLLTAVFAADPGNADKLLSQRITLDVTADQIKELEALGLGPARKDKLQVSPLSLVNAILKQSGCNQRLLPVVDEGVTVGLSIFGKP